MTQPSQTTESDPRTVGAVILAAGSSSRMGTPKQAIEVQGVSLLRRAVTAALEVGCSPVVVVIGANAEASRRVLNNLEIIEAYNPDWETGMGSSVRAGVGALERAAPNIKGAVILVCDQPAVTADYVSQLVRAQLETRAPVVASRYGGTYGVPAVFNAKLFSELAGLDCAAGAKQVIAKYEAEAVLIDLPAGDTDLDTLDDLSRYLQDISDT